MFKCFFFLSFKSRHTWLERLLLLGVFLFFSSQLLAQQYYACHLKITWEGKPKTQTNEKLSVIVEKYYYGKLLGLLGKYNETAIQDGVRNVAFTAERGWEIRFTLNGALSEKGGATFEIKQSELLQQKKKIRLRDNTILVLELKQERISKEAAKANSCLKVTSKTTKIQGISGILVQVAYKLPDGVSRGTGFIRAMDGRVSREKPIWAYQVFKGQYLANNLLVKLADTTHFQLFVPLHERPYWVSNLGFQLIHFSEGRLLEHFWTSNNSKQTDENDVTTSLFLKHTDRHKVQTQGVSVGVAVGFPAFYLQDLRKNQMTLNVSGDTYPGETRIWKYRVCSVDELARKNNRIIVPKSFIPYAWLAKFADTIRFDFKTKMFLMAHRGTQFYNGYPRQQSHLVAKKEERIELVLPALHQIKIRPVLFKRRKTWNDKTKARTAQYRKVQVLVRADTYKLYQSKYYDYRKTIRFNKVNREVLHLAHNDKIIIEVKDNAYPAKLLFKTEVACTANILNQKVWKLKDKNGNYLKIAVQQVTAVKDKLLDSNDKKQTKMLGGSR